MKLRVVPQLILGLLLSGTISTRAQEYQTEVSEAVADKVVPNSFLGKDASGNIYMSGLRHRMKMYLPLMVVNYVDVDVEKYIKKYNSNLELVDNKQVLTDNPALKQSQINGRINPLIILFLYSRGGVRNMDLPGWMVGDKYYMIIGDNKYPRNNYYAAHVNMESGLINTITPILSLGKKREQHQLELISFESKFSPDSSHILFIASYKKDKTNIAFSAAVFTRDMEPVWHSDYTLPKVTKTFTYGEAEVGNHGEVMILGRNYNKKEKNNPGYSSIFYMDKNQLKPKETRLNFGGDFVVQTHLALNTGSNPMIIGYYRTDRKKSGFDGLWYANLDEQQKVYNIRKKEFDADFIGSNYTSKEKRKLKRKADFGKDLREAGDYVFNEFFPTKDGGYIGIAEEYYLVIVESRDAKTGVVKHVSYQHHFNDLMAFKFNNEGVITSMNKIAKSNTYITGSSEKPYGKDYANCDYNNNMYVIFNDNEGLEENEHNKKGDFKQRNKVTYITRINEDGTLTKDVLIAKKTLGTYTFDPHLNICRLADNKIAFIASKGRGRVRKTRIGTVTIKNG